jgi:chromate transport protein ChrA
MQAGAHMVKLEGGGWTTEVVRFLVERGIPVCAHLGLTPQTVHALGGYRVQGKRGSFIAVLGMTLPSILVILLIAIFLQDALMIPWVVAGLKGILLSVSILFVHSFIDLSKPLKANPWLFLFTVLTFLFVFLNVLSPVLVMGLAIPFAILYSFVMVHRTPK